jgi:hypothetical protein
MLLKAFINNLQNLVCKYKNKFIFGKCKGQKYLNKKFFFQIDIIYIAPTKKIKNAR